MRFRSAKDDFCSTSLAVLPGPLEQLDYLATLRNDEGAYEHWGLERSHGREAVQEALREAHAEVVGKVLRLSLPELWEEGVRRPASLRVFLRPAGKLLPPNIDALRAAHFSLVAGALSAALRRPDSPLQAA